MVHEVFPQKHMPLFSDSVPLAPAVHLARLTDPARLAALDASLLLDGVGLQILDRLSRIASALLSVPVALVSLVDDRGQHFPGLAGLGGSAGDERGTPLSHSFCQHVVTRDCALVVEDAAHSALVRDNLARRDLGVVAYAGVPLRNAAGQTLGAFCAIDTTPRAWTGQDLTLLENLAAAAMAEISARSAVRRV